MAEDRSSHFLYERIAAGLGRAGYHDVSVDMIVEQLKKPRNQRTIIGMFAADAMVEWGDWKSVEEVLL